MALPTNITVNTAGHPGLHNAVNAAVNQLTDQVASLQAATIPTFPVGTDVSALPVGTVYGLYTPPHQDDTPQIRGYVTGRTIQMGNFTADPATGSGAAPQAGDTMILVTNTDDTDTSGVWTLPSGWSQTSLPVTGTMQPSIMMGAATGPGPLTFTNSTLGRTGCWALLWIAAGAPPASVTVGATKARSSAPAETTTCTCPSATVPASSLALSVAFERTAATEAAAPTWTGATSAVWVPQDASGSLATIAVATAQQIDAGATQASTCTFPNAQANNGLGVQIIVPRAS